MFIRTERSIKEFAQLYPIVTTLVVIHFVLWLMINFMQLPFAIELYYWGFGHNFSITINNEYWRFITPIFLHADLMHTLFNSFALVIFGPALERMLGKGKFIFAYLAAGIIGNLGTYFIDTTSLIPHVGASGSIFGLFGIYMYMVLRRKDLIDSANAQIVLTIFVIGLIMTFIRPNINIAGHIFGFIGGIALSPIILQNAVHFSNYPIHRKRQHKDGEIQFDPNRWNKRRLSKKMKRNLIWIIFAIIAIISLWNRF